MRSWTEVYDVKSRERNSHVLSALTSMKVNDELLISRKRQPKRASRKQPTETKSRNQRTGRLARGQLEHILSTNPAVVFLETPNHDGSELSSTYVSSSVTSLLGFDAETFTGESGASFWESRVHPDDLQRYRAEVPMLWR